MPVHLLSADHINLPCSTCLVSLIAFKLKKKKIWKSVSELDLVEFMINPCLIIVLPTKYIIFSLNISVCVCIHTYINIVSIYAHTHTYDKVCEGCHGESPHTQRLNGGNVCLLTALEAGSQGQSASGAAASEARQLGLARVPSPQVATGLRSVCGCVLISSS